MNSSQTHEAEADGKMSGLEETLRAYELNPFGQGDVCVMQRTEGTQAVTTEQRDGVTGTPSNEDNAVARRDTNYIDTARAVIGGCEFPGNTVVVNGAVSN